MILLVIDGDGDQRPRAPEKVASALQGNELRSLDVNLQKCGRMATEFSLKVVEADALHGYPIHIIHGRGQRTGCGERRRARVASDRVRQHLYTSCDVRR